ncbi:MAG TPA: antitoxin Xre-like helix-turn-helix domain-containing protein [Rhizobiaceae bacterium]|nr:antitoxin Xre-like helix-turn-helix domain-containing protein [Rhizobiaceae bacterium]
MQKSSKQVKAQQPDSQAVVTKAAVRAADQLGLTAKVLAKAIGVSEATVSRMRHGEYRLDGKPFELALLVIRLFRSLDAVTGGDKETAQRWIVNHNIAFGEAPLARLQTVAGLVDVIAYLDARRARI